MLYIGALRPNSLIIFAGLKSKTLSINSRILDSSILLVPKVFTFIETGFATPIAFVLASILLIISIIGVDIFAHLISSFTLLVYIGFSITSIFFGKLFTKLLKIEGKVKFVLFTLVSSIILWVLSQIPFVGGLFGIITCLFGIGLTLVNIFVKNEKVKESETTEVEVKE